MYRASCRLTRVSVQMARFTQKPSQKGARKCHRSSMTLPLRYVITDGDKNCIGVVCPPFMSSACHLSCAVRLNMRVDSRSHQRLMQRSPSGRTVQAVLQTTLLCHRVPCNRHHSFICLLHGSSEALTGYTAHTANHCIIHSELCCIGLLCSLLCRMRVSLHFNFCGTHF